MNHPADYRHSHIDPNKGTEYDLHFRRFRWRRYLWKREQAVLHEILRDFFTGRPVRCLDFACGTGRILEFMKDQVDEAAGVDVSESMLARCVSRVPGSTLYRGDITRDNVLGTRRYDLITAFRFFANAQPTLREEAIDALGWHLAENGLLVFNNHRNRSGLLFRLARCLGKTFHTMSREETRGLLTRVGFEVVRTYGLGLLPEHDTAPFGLPGPLHDAADWLGRRFGADESLCQDVIYVCRKRRLDDIETAGETACLEDSPELVCVGQE